MGKEGTPSLPPPLFLLPAEKLEGGELNSQLGARPSSQNLPKGWLLLEHALLEEGGRERRDVVPSSRVRWGRIHNEGETGQSEVLALRE